MKWIALLLVATSALAAADAPIPSKQPPLPSSPKQAEDRTATDPTLAATRATVQGSIGSARGGPAPFQKFTIPNPLEGQSPILTRTPLVDAEAPVSANAGKPPIPVLK